MKRSFWISLDYATYLIESKDDIIIKAAPIAKWMIGKNLNEIKPFLIRKKAIVKEL